MTRDDAIRMAMDVGLMDKVDNSSDYFIRADAFDDEIVRFAELVAAAERERLNKKIAALEADVDHFFKLSGGYLERANKAEEAVAAERERCAQICDAIERRKWEILRDGGKLEGLSARDCAAMIRWTK